MKGENKMSISMVLLLILCALMVINQVIGISNGWYREGFSLTKMVCGFQKYGIILIGYAAIALIAFFGGKAIPQLEYLSGLLLEPIARYFSKLVGRLTKVLGDDIEDVIQHRRAVKHQRTLAKNAKSMASVNVREGTVQLISTVPSKGVGYETVSEEEESDNAVREAAKVLQSKRSSRSKKELNSQAE